MQTELISKAVSTMSHHDSVWIVLLCALGLLILILVIPCCRCLCFYLRERKDLKKEKRRWSTKTDSKSFVCDLHESHRIKDGNKSPNNPVIGNNNIPPSYEEAILLS